MKTTGNNITFDDAVNRIARRLSERLTGSDSKLSGTISALFQRDITQVSEIIRGVCAEEYQELQDRLETMASKSVLEREKNDLEWDVSRLREDKARLERENAALAEKFPDEKIRNAYVLFCQIVNTAQNDYQRQRAISAAGAIVAASLGMQTYFGKAVDAINEQP